MIGRCCTKIIVESPEPDFTVSLILLDYRKVALSQSEPQGLCS